MSNCFSLSRPAGGLVGRLVTGLVAPLLTGAVALAQSSGSSSAYRVPHAGHPHEVLPSRTQQARTPQGPGGQGAVPQGLGTAQNGTTGPFTDINISLDLLFAIGTSTERDEQLVALNGGEHDPRRRGVTIQQAELQLNGAIDEWFTAQGVLVSFLDPEGETVVELEEAFLQTSNLPHRFQAKIGHYFTEFGRLNPLHPHAWDWQSQPVILTRVFGPEGMRAPGARVSWLAPMHQYLEFFLAGQNANGETMTSFASSDEAYEERPIGGRFFNRAGVDARSGQEYVWSGRVATTFEVGDEALLGIGGSFATGDNATGPGANTLITGVDFAYQWQPKDAQPGSAFFRLQGEYVHRDFEVAAQVDTGATGNPSLPGQTLRDHGGYLYGLVGWDNGFAAGLRCEYATGSGASYLGDGMFGRNMDPFRADRIRISPMMQYQVSQFSRIRLQYDYDDSAHLSGTAHSVWLGFEVLLGAQPQARVGRDGLRGCSCRCVTAPSTWGGPHRARRNPRR